VARSADLPPGVTAEHIMDLAPQTLPAEDADAAKQIVRLLDALLLAAVARPAPSTPPALAAAR
jgi:hypothetical protein